MKLFKQLSFVLCIAILCLSACKKSGNNDNSSNEGDTSVKTFGGVHDETGNAVCQTADGAM